MRIVVLLSIAASIAFAWSIGLDREWGTDYGVYYVGAKWFSAHYHLYVEHFDHKGPVYYAFLRCIGAVIGFGPLQAVVSLFLTTLFFVGSVLWIARLITKSILRQVLVVLLSGALLAFQPTNASISLFQTTLLIWSFYFLYSNLHTRRQGDIYVSVVFYLLAGLTRVDAFIFAPMYLFSRFETGRNIRNYVKISVIGLLSSIGLFWLFSLTFGFNFTQYFYHNFVFNAIHGASRGPELLYIWYRPETFKLLLVSGIPVVLAIILSNLQEDKSHRFLLFISGMGFLAFAVTNSDKNYHLFILYAPLLFSVIGLIKNLRLENTYQVALLSAFLLYSNAILGLNMIGFAVDVRDRTFLTPKSDNDLECVAKIRELGVGYGIFERSWIYLFADVKPEMSLVPAVYNRRYADSGEFFQNTGLADLHSKLLSKNGTDFFLNKGYLDRPNAWLQEVLDASSVINDTGTYQIRRIGRFDYGSASDHFSPHKAPFEK